MAELADAQDSGSCRSDPVQVQVLLPAPKRNHNIDTKNIGIMAFLLKKGGLPFYRFYSKNTGLPGWFSSLQAFFVFNGKKQIVHFISVSFNLWGIVQFVIN